MFITRLEGREAYGYLLDSEVATRPQYPWDFSPEYQNSILFLFWFSIDFIFRFLVISLCIIKTCPIQSLL